MKALSIMQPWAHAILHWGKDVENRTWSTKFRGEFYIHAGLGFDQLGWDWMKANWNSVLDLQQYGIAAYGMRAQDFQRGGLVGIARLDHVIENIRDAGTCAQSRPFEWPWLFGPKGFVLADVRAIPFAPLKGQLGFFEVSDNKESA